MTIQKQVLKRYTIKFVVLTAEEIPDITLGNIYEQTITGDYSGEWMIESVEDLTREEMAQALEAQGSDPSFLLGEEDDGIDE